ncbi:MAG: cation transporter [Rubrobacteridae bacterium]|nr:cation transporter [Rubrobacteridae bacterium]
MDDEFGLNRKGPLMQGHHGVTTNIRALRISAVLILIYFVFEITVALATGSLALLADAGHELSTFVAIAISLLAIQLALKEPTPKRTFGFLRVEILAALFNGVLLLAMAIFILVQGSERLQNPMEIPSTPMFIMAIGGIGLEIASLYIMYRGQKESLNIRGSFWHVVNAFLGSLAVIIAATFISVAGIYVADAWAGIVFAFILIWAAYGIIRDSFNILIDATPKNIDLTAIDRDLTSIPGTLNTHHLHARTVTGQITIFSGHLVVSDLKDTERILVEAKRLLDRKYKFALSTLQIENETLAEAALKALEFKRGTEENH